MALTDKHLEAKLLKQLLKLELLNDAVGPTALRHRLSDLIVQTRRTLKSFDQEEYERVGPDDYKLPS